jgi:hypothetical protein
VNDEDCLVFIDENEDGVCSSELLGYWDFVHRAETQ